MFEVRRVLHRSEVFTPIFAGNRMLSMPELEILGAETVDPEPERLARCVLITTELPKMGQWTRLPARRFDIPADCPLVFGDTHLPVAAIGHIESVVSDAIGPHLLATIRFNATKLGEICYRGMCGGVLSGCCAVISWGIHVKTGRAMGLVREVRLGALESSCLSSARVWPIREVQHDWSQSKKEKIGKEIFVPLPPIKRPRPIKLPDTGTGSAGLPPPVIKRPTAK